MDGFILLIGLLIGFIIGFKSKIYTLTFWITLKYNKQYNHIAVVKYPFKKPIIYVNGEKGEFKGGQNA